MKNFYTVLINTLVANITTSYLWFALTFWVYLETKAVITTSIIGGSYILLVALLGILFGTIVDRNKKKHVMVASSVITLMAYAIAGLLYIWVPHSNLVDWTSGYFWLFAGIILVGGVVEHMRNIALSTAVTLLVPKDRRDKANGLIGSVQGVAFLTTSVISGISIGLLGMGKTLVLAMIVTVVVLVHLKFVSIPEKNITYDPELKNKAIDFRGSLMAVRAVPGLLALISFTTFNNFIGGVHMALIDPYGLTLFSVEVWGIVLGVAGTGFIIGGLAIAKKGLGKNPLKTLLIANMLIGLISMFFTIREVWLLYVIGIFGHMVLVPVVEAAENTVIQRVVPFNKQGRTFGFAQSIEAMASPFTAFIIGPIAQFWVIPYASSERGREKLTWLLGSGDARGIALIFTIAGIILFLVAYFARKSKPYKHLSSFYARS